MRRSSVDEIKKDLIPEKKPKDIIIGPERKPAPRSKSFKQQSPKPIRKILSPITSRDSIKKEAIPVVPSDSLPKVVAKKSPVKNDSPTRLQPPKKLQKVVTPKHSRPLSQDNQQLSQFQLKRFSMDMFNNNIENK